MKKKVQRMCLTTAGVVAGFWASLYHNITAKADNILNPSSEEMGDMINNLINTENNAAAEGGALSEGVNIVKSYGSAGVSLTRMVFIYVLLIMLIVTAIVAIIYAGNSSKMSDTKIAAVRRFAAGIGGFAAVALVVLFAKVGTNVF